VNAIYLVIAARFTAPKAFEGGARISAGNYVLMWDLAKADIPAS
jgi:hypothetical protein